LFLFIFQLKVFTSLYAIVVMTCISTLVTGCVLETICVVQNVQLRHEWTTKLWSSLEQTVALDVKLLKI